jgi:hypothetical protein
VKEAVSAKSQRCGFGSVLILFGWNQGGKKMTHTKEKKGRNSCFEVPVCGQEAFPVA